ncbi:hypothetical protein [Streptomyces huasconensis]|uniref:hypothetical protein n=1 Tax=Streptomyces TaxID=1883 RepID=UPI0038B4BFAC|nr:hypothetical protein J2N69_30450 [Streptomyces huasconensis]
MPHRLMTARTYATPAARLERMIATLESGGKVTQGVAHQPPEAGGEASPRATSPGAAPQRSDRSNHVWVACVFGEDRHAMVIGDAPEWSVMFMIIPLGPGPTSPRAQGIASGITGGCGRQCTGFASPGALVTPAPYSPSIRSIREPQGTAHSRRRHGRRRFRSRRPDGVGHRGPPRAGSSRTVRGVAEPDGERRA